MLRETQKKPLCSPSFCVSLESQTCSRWCCDFQAAGGLALTDFMLQPHEVQLGRRVAGGAGGQIFVGKFGMQEVRCQVLKCAVSHNMACALGRL